uniref:Uncharacterized protein n=1 Tax=Timema tahoe TaxID=61484 RepID=A0A7R9NUW4_9NEOP|nr:unnamed protein product [Timema tahoe]
MGKSLHLVDFLVQNMPTQAIDKPTLHTLDASGSGFNTALHLCAIHDKPECMKLLLRSGADITLKNSQDKTPMAIAREQGNITCENLLHYALERQKSHFENVFTDWNLLHDEASTDFSDDETIIDDRKSDCTKLFVASVLLPSVSVQHCSAKIVGTEKYNIVGIGVLSSLAKQSLMWVVVGQIRLAAIHPLTGNVMHQCPGGNLFLLEFSETLDDFFLPSSIFQCEGRSLRKCPNPPHSKLGPRRRFELEPELLNGSLTPEKKSRSRPPSFVGDSPVNPRSRSSTSDSLKSGSSPNSSYRPVPPPPPPQNRKPSSEFLAADLEVPGSVLDWYLVIFL